MPNALLEARDKAPQNESKVEILPRNMGPTPALPAVVTGPLLSILSLLPSLLPQLPPLPPSTRTGKVLPSNSTSPSTSPHSLTAISTTTPPPSLTTPSFSTSLTTSSPSSVQRSSLTSSTTSSPPPSVLPFSSANSTTVSVQPTTSSSPTTSPRKVTVPVGPIVGGVIAVVFFWGAFLVLFAFLRRKIRSRQSTATPGNSASSAFSGTSVAEPPNMDMLENAASVEFIPRASHPSQFAKGGQYERPDTEVATFASSTTHETDATHAIGFHSMDFVPYVATLSSRDVEAHAVSVNLEEEDEEDSFPPNYREDASPPEYRDACV